jgi:hypothetical protein
MNKDQLTPSVLKVTANENVDISNDLKAQQTKSISQLIQNEEEKTDQKENKSKS